VLSEDEHLAAVPGRRNAGGPVNVHADIVVATQVPLPGVEAHPHANGTTFGPRLTSQGPLRLNRCPKRPWCCLKDGEERVPLGAQDRAAMCGKRLAQQALVGFENLGITIAKCPQETGTPRDVTEQERDGSGRQIRSILHGSLQADQYGRIRLPASTESGWRIRPSVAAAWLRPDARRCST
jgi:hypothetical protein